MFENLTKKKCRYFLTALFAAVGISYVAVAETANGNAETLQCDVCGLDQLTAPIDLEGASVTVDDISADRQYVNSSETPAVLVFDTDDDVAFGGSVHDNILIVKKGEGKIAFAKENSHTLGMIISNGTVSVSAENQLGPGTLTFAGGTLDVAQSFTQTEVIFDFTGDVGTINVAEGAVLTISNQFFKTENGVFTKTGAGEIVVATQFKEFSNKARWVISEGVLQIAKGDTWGSHAATADFTLEIRENAEVCAEVHVPMPNVVMRGGILRHIRSVITSKGEYLDFPNYSFKQLMTVLPSTDGTPSRVFADLCYSANGELIPVFNVAKDAELEMDCVLEGGYAAKGGIRIGGGFIKRGAGTLTLCHACNFDDGAVQVENGVLRLKKGASISAATDMTVARNAKIELDDGAVLDCAAKGIAADDVLATADVWLDATAYNASDAIGELAPQVANKGTAGGSFGMITEGGINPNAPEWRAFGINNLPAFYFDGNAMLRLDSYSYTGHDLTMYAVVMRKKYVKYNGYVSMKSTDGTSDSATGHFRVEESARTTKHVFSRTGASVTLSGVVDDGSPFCDFYESTESFRTVWHYRNDGGIISGEDSTKVTKAFDIDVVGVGGRMGAGNTAQYDGVGKSSNRMYDGYVGELLVWSRKLTDDEKAKVTAYIKDKWFGVSAETQDSVGSVTVDVAEGSGGVASLCSGEIVKKGEGELLLGNASAAKDVEVDEGTLTFASTALVHKAAIWVDAADSSTLTVADGKVVGARNKGSSGGVFTRNLRGGDVSPDAPALATDINGLSTILFDGNAALALDGSYVNKKADRRIRIYMVGRRSEKSDISVNNTGRYSGPFSMTSVELDGKEQNHLAALHIEEIEDKAKLTTNVNFYVGKGEKITLSSDFYEKTVPFILTAQIGTSAYSFGLEMQGGEGGFAKSGNGDVVHGAPAMDIDIVQLGGRLGDFGKATWLYRDGVNNRMWCGSIGEFIVCDAQLTEAEHISITNYLHKKWFAGDVSIAKPRALETVFAPQLSEKADLTLAQGTTLASHVATLPLASLTVEGTATLVRGGVTDSANYAMFNVSGGMSLPSAMTFIPLCLPDSNYAKLLMGAAAQGAGATTWTIGDGSSTKWSASTSAEGVAISRAGMSIVIR